MGENENKDTVTQALLKTATPIIHDDVDEMPFQPVLNDKHVANYSRYLPWYYHEMACLPQTHPELHAYLNN